jgi:septum formation protein
MTRNLILASASTVRARLLTAAGIDFRVEPAEFDESVIKQACRAQGCDAGDCALALAEAKASQVSDRRDRALVVGVDQLLVSGEAWLDKPVDLGQARVQLHALRGRTHELATAACAVRSGKRLWHAVSRPRLTMRDLTDAFLDNYIVAEGGRHPRVSGRLPA